MDRGKHLRKDAAPRHPIARGSLHVHGVRGRELGPGGSFGGQGHAAGVAAGAGSMRNHKEVVHLAFRKSLCVRNAHISSLIR